MRVNRHFNGEIRRIDFETEEIECILPLFDCQVVQIHPGDGLICQSREGKVTELKDFKPCRSVETKVQALFKFHFVEESFFYFSIEEASLICCTSFENYTRVKVKGAVTSLASAEEKLFVGFEEPKIEVYSYKLENILVLSDSSILVKP